VQTAVLLTYLFTYTQRHIKRQSVRAAYKLVLFWSVVPAKWWPLFYNANCNISLVIIYSVGGWEGGFLSQIETLWKLECLEWRL